MTDRRELTPTTIRRCGLAAVGAALASIPLAPLNALARMQTESGRSDLANETASWWAEPALQSLGPWLLDFAGPDTVYRTYGMFYAVAVTAVLACMLAARSLRPHPMSWTERWGWRLALAGYAMMFLGFVAFYWLRVGGDSGYVIVLFGMLLGVPGNILLGIGLLRGGFRPRFAAWVILLDLPLSIGLVAISTQALGMWTMTSAWGVVGWSLWRHGADVPLREPDERAGVRSPILRTRT
jgi:hypothetical protein